MMVKLLTVLRNRKVKQQKAGCTMEEAMRTAMQVRITMKPKFVTVFAVLNFQLLLFHVHTKTEKYNKSMFKKYS